MGADQDTRLGRNRYVGRRHPARGTSRALIVLDASALAEYLKASRRGYQVAEQLRAASFQVHMPHLCSIETTSILRRWVRQSEMTISRASAALVDLADFSAVRHAHEPYLERIWALRNNVSSYDAVYVALAEALGAPLLTCDGRLARALLTSATVEVVEVVP